MDNKIFKLKNRLFMCSAFVSNTKIADIGSDHAKLPIWLFRNSIIKYGIASDINKDSVKKSQRNIKIYGVSKFIEPRLSDGFENILENEADDIIISGLGGNTISKILFDCKWKNKESKKFILQPSARICELRTFLINNGYEILKEEAIIEKTHINLKKYTVMLVVFNNNKKKYDDFYPFLGEILNSTNKLNLKFYLDFQIKETLKKIKGFSVLKDETNLCFYKKILDNLIYFFRK